MTLFENHPYFQGGYWEHRTANLVRGGCAPDSLGLQLENDQMSTQIIDMKCIKTGSQSKRMQRLLEAMKANTSMKPEDVEAALDLSLIHI